MKTGILMAAVVAVAAIVGLVGQARTEAVPPKQTAEARTGALDEAFDLDEPTSADGTADADATVQGNVREVIDVAEYSYLRLTTPQGEVWAAVSKTPVVVGSDVAIENPTRMENFQSATLKRTFDVIYFGNLAAAGAANHDALPPGHPSLDGAGSSPHMHSGAATNAATPELADVRVPRASGSNGHTVGELFADGPKLEGKLLRVRGQVVKVTPGVLGKTYVRLRDGSGSRPEERELVVTTSAEPRVGDVSTFEGTLRTQVDVGIGYKYPVLLSDAELVADPTAKAL